MLPDLIKLFNLVAVSPDETLLNAVEINQCAMRCGYFIHPRACTADVVTFLKSQEENLNSTFYKDWQDVTRRTELEMRILQMVHYMTTYGTDFQGAAFTVNESPAEMQFSQFKIIMPCSDRELFERLGKLLATPAALSDNLLDLICKQLRQYSESYDWSIDIDNIANREAQTRLCELYGILPDKPENLLRLFIYKATGKSMLIKDKRTIENITRLGSCTASCFNSLSQRQMVGLASIFYRHKALFLAFRKSFLNSVPSEPQASAAVNRIRRMARIFHRPAKAGVLESILSHEHSLSDIAAAARREKSNFKLIRIVGYLGSISPENKLCAYIIRNGKLFIAPNRRKRMDYDNINKIRDIILDEILNRMRLKAVNADGRPVSVRFPKSVSLAMPASERQFVGNVPYGSAYRLRSNNLVGIYWRNEWGTRDFDLWLTSDNGQRLGWNANHKDGDLLFSGDMTNAEPEATEIFYGKGDTWPDCVISVARYNGEQGSKFRLFFASDDIKELPLGYIVRPDSIIFQEDIVSDSRQTAIGVVSNGQLYFGSLGTGNTHIPENAKELSVEKALAWRLSSSVDLKSAMLEAGFVEHDENSGTAPDIDLRDLKKDTLLSLCR